MGDNLMDIVIKCTNGKGVRGAIIFHKQNEENENAFDYTSVYGEADRRV